MRYIIAVAVVAYRTSRSSLIRSPGRYAATLDATALATPNVLGRGQTPIRAWHVSKLIRSKGQSSVTISTMAS